MEAVVIECRRRAGRSGPRWGDPVCIAQDLEGIPQDLVTGVRQEADLSTSSPTVSIKDCAVRNDLVAGHPPGVRRSAHWQRPYPGVRTV